MTDGLAFSANPCLSRQYAALSTTGYPTGLYVNTGNPGPSSSHWPTAPTTTPARCLTAGDPDDPGCAYDYGWAAAADSVAQAQAAGITVSGRTWWLDVEQDNSWAPNSGDTATTADYQANAADLQGEMDGLYAKGVTQVGIYSTDLQWQQITGGLTTTTQSAYVAAWSSYLTPGPALSAAPLWIAGATDEAGAYANCSQTFTGAAAALAQYSDAADADADLVCGGTPVAPPATVPGAPRDPGSPSRQDPRRRPELGGPGFQRRRRGDRVTASTAEQRLVALSYDTTVMLRQHLFPDRHRRRAQQAVLLPGRRGQRRRDRPDLDLGDRRGPLI